MCTELTPKNCFGRKEVLQKNKTFYYENYRICGQILFNVNLTLAKYTSSLHKKG